jgi:hypothetical protein
MNIVNYHKLEVNTKKERVPFASLPNLPRKDVGELMGVDYNKYSDFELKKAKEAMEIEFKNSQIKKESENYQYDVKKNFGPPTEKIGWDSDEDDTMPLKPLMEKKKSLTSSSLANSAKDLASPASAGFYLINKINTLQAQQWQILSLPFPNQQIRVTKLPRVILNKRFLKFPPRLPNYPTKTPKLQRKIRLYLRQLMLQMKKLETNRSVRI